MKVEEYEEVKKQREQKSTRGGKRRAATQESSDADESLMEKIDKLVERSQVKDVLIKSILECFKCCVCLKISSKAMVGNCCQRIIGGQDCVERWFDNEERCPLCKAENAKDNVFMLKEIGEFSIIIAKLEEN